MRDGRFLTDEVRCSGCNNKLVSTMGDLGLVDFVNLVPVGIGANNFDENFSKIFANQSYYDLLGFTEEEFLERFPFGGLDAFHPEDRDNVRTLAKTDLLEKGFVFARTRVVHKTKGYIWVQYSGRLVKSLDSAPKIYISVVDISDVISSSEALAKTVASLKLTEESLRTEREINDFAVDTKYDLVSLLDVTNRELIVYKKGKAFLDGGLVSRGDYDVAARFVMDNLVHPDDRESFRRLFFDSLVSEVDSKGRLVLEYRLFDKDSDSYRWKRVLYRYFKNSTDMLIQLTEDINKDMSAKMKLEADQSLNNMIADLTGDAFFDCDLVSKTIRYSKNFAIRFGLDEVVYDYPESVISKGCVAKDSIYLFKDRFLGSQGDEVVHLITPSNEHVWCQYLYSVIEDDFGKAVRVVGKITDITKQYLKMEELLDKTKKDQLTNLYNKSTTELIIKEFLESRRFSDERCALMIVDIDNFKSINDKLGHIYGDIALSELANLLREVFAVENVVGRIGGDEFFVFVRHFESLDSVRAKAKQVCRLFRRSYGNGDLSVDISSSVGIAIFPDHGREFDELYRACDMALYRAKANGKDGFSVFDGSNASAYESFRTAIDVHDDLPKILGDGRVEFVFRMLYDCDFRVCNMESVLRLIAEYFDFDRGIVNLFDFDKGVTSCFYEWHGDGVFALKDKIQNISNDVLAHVISRCKENRGLFSLMAKDMPFSFRSLSEIKGLSFAFYFPLFDGDTLLGSLSFHNCTDELMKMSSKDFDDLNSMCKVLANFLVKKLGFEKASSYQRSIATVLDNIDAFVYVVDMDSFSVLFENKKVTDLTSKDSVGKVCYIAYAGKDRPCKDCPVKNLSPSNKSSSIEMFSKQWGVYTKSTGSMIKWSDSKEAYMMSCVDITEYKK